MPDEEEYRMLSPMMQHYIDTKKEYPGTILFYRLGDFYEMFFEDAETVSRELELTLTGKSCGLPERAPMCGVPFHAADTYISRLIAKGYRVAVCEQLEDPKKARGIVKRDVIRVISPGTTLDASALDVEKNNYIMCIYREKKYGIAISDISTGDFFMTEVDDTSEMAGELERFSPAEVLLQENFRDESLIEECIIRLSISKTVIGNEFFSKGRVNDTITGHFKVTSLSGLGLIPDSEGTKACGALLNYLMKMLKVDPAAITNITPINTKGFMLLDQTAIRNLELVETLREKKKTGSLLGVLDQTKTAMGARKLRDFIEKPLTDQNAINDRLDAVEELSAEEVRRIELRQLLDRVYDLERLLTRITYNTANPRDILSFRDSISVLAGIKSLISDVSSDLLVKIDEDIDPLTDIEERITAEISDDAPVTIHDGDLIKDGYSAEVDELRGLKTGGKQVIAEIEQKERENTGIKNLRIKYNKVFGYYLEVTNSNLGNVPDYFIRKQTLTNAERFVTPRLKELEEKLLTATEKLSNIEFALFEELKGFISENIIRIQRTAKAVAALDVYLSLAHVAVANRYVRPVMRKDGVIKVKEGRHPVVEKLSGKSRFVPNDALLDDSGERIAIITGPNMAGKSTYMRQVAIIVLMAQMGSFVPASSAEIGICDRIFTRVGASDDLAAGASTFMVEMTEVANILRHATKDSLLILDEIGRGTSTFDGLSIAWAVVEYIASNIFAKTLFATHYHELTKLQGKLFGVKNYRIAVREQGSDIIFLRKIMPGGADKSYGISVAALAGVPEEVLSRARMISAELSGAGSDLVVEKVTEKSMSGQLSFFDLVSPGETRDETAKDPSPVVLRLRETDPDALTPKEALDILYELREMI